MTEPEPDKSDEEALDDQGLATGDHVPDGRLASPVSKRRDSRGPHR